MSLIISFFVSLIALAIAVPIFFGIVRLFGLYITVQECHAKVFVLFGKVIGTIDEPGLHLPITTFGPKALLVRFFGKVYDLDMRIDQRYLRSQAVNTEEGTPMGIGVWYEMRVTNATAFLFENTDPAGSLEANVTNATVRSLSNMPLADMLEDRHFMSRTVRGEVSPKSESWGYSLGSVYIRKVHFRDRDMIDQIEQKVINRLRQVTSAIRQAGDNQVDVITSRAEKEAAKEFARAAAIRPQLVGNALAEISNDPEVLEALFDTLETEKLVHSEGQVVLLPEDRPLLAELAAGNT